MNMLTAGELTALVASTHPDRSRFAGVSDHIPHLQDVEITVDDVKHRLVIVSFNVLAPRCVPYMTGIPLPGGTLPGWFSGLENQAGLENVAAFQPENQEERGLLVFQAIAEMIASRDRPPFVICLQECDSVLYARLKNIQELCKFDIETSRPPEDSCFCATLISRKIVWEKLSTHPQAITISIPALRTTIVNGHLDFSTESNVQHFDTFVGFKGETGLIVVGDFNIQTGPLSPESLKEGKCTATLTEFTTRLEAKTGLTARFAAHPQGFTNWNLKMNCADRTRTWDHFDNIMVLTHKPEAFRVEAVDFDLVWTA
jgi:hypothetical protein